MLLWDSYPDMVLLIPGRNRIKLCLLFVSLSGKNEIIEKINKKIKKLHGSSPVWSGEARRFSLGLGIHQELAQIILLSKYFPQELQFLCWICKTQPTATRWRQDGKSAAAAAQRAAAQSTPQSLQVRVCLPAHGHTCTREKEERQAHRRRQVRTRSELHQDANWAKYGVVEAIVTDGAAPVRAGNKEEFTATAKGSYRTIVVHWTPDGWKETNIKHADATLGSCHWLT